MRLPSRFLTHLSVLLIGLGTTQHAYAYLDPGTGSFLLQMIIAGALGAYLYIKLAWVKTKMFFAGLFSGKAEEPEANSDPEDPGKTGP